MVKAVQYFWLPTFKNFVFQITWKKSCSKIYFPSYLYSIQSKLYFCVCKLFPFNVLSYILFNVQSMIIKVIVLKVWRGAAALPYHGSRGGDARYVGRTCWENKWLDCGYICHYIPWVSLSMNFRKKSFCTFWFDINVFKMNDPF